jgi:hypothetical protein
MNKNLLGAGLASVFIACGQDTEGNNGLEIVEPDCQNIMIAVTNQPETGLIVDDYLFELADYGTNLLSATISICHASRLRISLLSENNGELFVFPNDPSYSITVVDTDSDSEISCTDSTNKGSDSFHYEPGITNLELRVQDENCQL